MATLVLIQEAAEDGWRVKVGPALQVSERFHSSGFSTKISPAHVVNTAVNANQSARVHVSDHSVILNGKISASVLTAGVARVGSVRRSLHCRIFVKSLASM